MPNVSDYLTFGVELEAARLAPDAPSIIAARGFDRHYDATIRGSNGEELPRGPLGGAELTTKPLPVRVNMDQTGDRYTADFGETEAIVRDLCRCVAQVNVSCGLHVHFGRPVSAAEMSKSRWEPKHIRAWLAIGGFLEEKMFGLCPPSRRGNRYCKKISEEYPNESFVKFYPVGEVRPRKYDNPKRYCWLNLIETRREGLAGMTGASGPALGTVEIRMLGNVRRHSYIWAWIRLWTRVAAYVAYVDPLTALMHCTLSNSIAYELNEVAIRAPGAPGVTVE